jgi:hypothetical protein
MHYKRLIFFSCRIDTSLREAKGHLILGGDLLGVGHCLLCGEMGMFQGRSYAMQID